MQVSRLIPTLSRDAEGRPQDWVDRNPMLSRAIFPVGTFILGLAIGSHWLNEPIVTQLSAQRDNAAGHLIKLQKEIAPVNPKSVSQTK